MRSRSAPHLNATGAIGIIWRKYRADACPLDRALAKSSSVVVRPAQRLDPFVDFACLVSDPAHVIR
jgi:hypothetical protein